MEKKQILFSGGLENSYPEILHKIDWKGSGKFVKFLRVAFIQSGRLLLENLFKTFYPRVEANTTLRD